MIKKVFKHLDQILTKISIFFIKIYQYTISPDKGIFSSVLKGTVCAHHPHCSEYSVRTLKRYGFIFGIGKVMNRVTSCTPSNSIKYDPEYYKVVFFSSAPIGVPFLEALHEDKRFEITGVVTNPDQKSGRGMKMKENIIKTVGKKIYQQTDDKIKIINYNTKYKKEIALLYDKCFNNPKFGISYNYNYFYNNIDRRSSCKNSYIGKIFLENDKFAGYFQAYKTEDMEGYLNRTFGINNINKLFSKEHINLKKEVYRLDDIIITHQKRGKGYFNILLDDLYNEVNKRDKNIIAIYTTKDLVEKYIKRNFKIIGKIYSQKDKVLYYFMVKNINKKTIPNLLVLHGYNSSANQNFFQNLKQKTEKLGIKTTILNLPNSNTPSIPEQTEYVFKNYNFDENTIILGHSLGSIIGLNVLQQLNTKIKQYISVAGFLTNNLTLERKYFQTFDFNFDKKKILGNLSEKSIIIYDPKDKNIPVKQAELLEEYFSTTKITLSTQKPHFLGDQEEELCEYISDKISSNFLNSQTSSNTFIQTPKSLRLDSKKYAEEAHNFKLRLEAKNPDYLVVIAYGKIIPQYILDIPNLAPINIHGSLLPKYRGASPIQSVFLNNETESGITIMKMDATMDTGNMIDKLKTKLKFNRNTLDLIERMKEKGPKFLNKTLWKYGKDLLGEETQNEKHAIYCEKIEKSEGEINPYTDSLEDIYAKYKAYFLRPKIYFKHEKSGTEITCTIDSLTLDEKIFSETKEQTIFTKENKLNPAITEINIKPEGKKSMDRKSFVNGYLR